MNLTTQQAADLQIVRRGTPEFNHASPEETAKRRARIAEAGPRLRTRLADMYAAKELVRQCELLTAWEVFNLLNTVMSAMRCAGGSDMERYRTALAEVACDIENDLTGDAPEPAQRRGDNLPSGALA